jgi:hypothetical protein
MNPENSGMNDKPVALVGFSDTLRQVDSLEGEVPIWVVNASELSVYDLPRIDAVFDIHKIQDLILDKPRMERLAQKQDYPIYMQHEFGFFPSVVKYPREAMADEMFKNLWIGSANVDYVDSSFPYMLALAYMEGHNPIYVFGFEFKPDTEYRYQRVGAALMIGLVGGRGVDVILPEGNALLPPTSYGYAEYQTVGRQSLEIELARFTNRTSVEIGNYNIAETQLRERRDNGSDEAAIDEAEEARNKAFRMMYRNEGVSQFISFLIDQMDRKQGGFGEFQDMLIRSSEVDK